MRITVQDPAYGPGAMCLYLNGHELDRVRQMAEGIAIRADGPEHVGLRRVLDGVLGAIDGFRTPPPVGLRYETRVFSGVVAPRTALAAMVLHQMKTARMRPDPDALARLLSLPPSGRKDI